MCKFFLEIADCHWTINGKTFFMCGRNIQLKKYLVEHKECLSNCPEISRGNKISAGANILSTLIYLLTIGFFGKSITVLPREVQKSV